MAKAKKKSFSKWLILIAIGVAAIIALAYFFKPEEAVKVTIETVEKRTLIATVSESGTVQPATEVKIAPDVSGEIVELKCKEGNQVKKGDLLMTIRPDNYKSALEQSEAALNSSQANYLQAQANRSQAKASYLQDSANYSRTNQLYRDSVVSRIEKETALLKREVSKSQYESAKQSVQASFFQMKSSQASLRQARQNLDRTNIFATMDGTVTMLNIELGERVVGTMQMAGTEMLRIADLSEMDVLVEINENDIINIQIGDTAKIKIDAYGEKEFRGWVSEIAYSAKMLGMGSTEQVTNFEVKVRIDPKSYQNDPEIIKNPSAKISPFRPGMSAQVEIYTEKEENVIGVPIGCVSLQRKKEGAVEENQKAQEIVFVYENGKVTEVNVETGISDDKYIRIKSGLNEGQQVVTGPYLILTKKLENNLEVGLEKEEKAQDKKKK